MKQILEKMGTFCTEKFPLVMIIIKTNCDFQHKSMQYRIQQIYVLNFFPPKCCFRILILFLESKFSFSAHISTFFVVIYIYKTWIGILNTDLDFKLKLEF